MSSMTLAVDKTLFGVHMQVSCDSMRWTMPLLWKIECVDSGYGDYNSYFCYMPASNQKAQVLGGAARAGQILESGCSAM